MALDPGPPHLGQLVHQGPVVAGAVHVGVCRRHQRRHPRRVHTHARLLLRRAATVAATAALALAAPGLGPALQKSFQSSLTSELRPFVHSLRTGAICRRHAHRSVQSEM